MMETSIVCYLLGFAGDSCSVNIDDCQNEPCLNGATCEDDVNKYVCHCHKGILFCPLDRLPVQNWSYDPIVVSS